MKNNPLSSLLTPEQKKIYDKIRFHSFFYPFKRRRLNQVGCYVKKILDGFNITNPIVFNFKTITVNCDICLISSKTVKFIVYFQEIKQKIL